MPSTIHSMIMTLYVALAFSFGICVGSKWGISETKKAYSTHVKVFK